MKQLLLYLIIVIVSLTVFQSAFAEFIIDPENWDYIPIADSEFEIKLPRSFSTDYIYDPTDGAERFFEAGDPDFGFSIIDCGTYTDLSSAASFVEDRFELSGIGPAIVNDIETLGFVASDVALYGILVFSENNHAYELDFILAENDEGNERALYKATMMIETLRRKNA